MRYTKKVIASILAVWLLLSFCPFYPQAQATESAKLPKNLTSEAATAYAKYLLPEAPYYESRYAVIETLGPDHTPVLRIIDAPGGGAEESILFYQNGKVEPLYSYLAESGNSNYGTFFVTVVDGINYYGYCHEGNGSEYYESAAGGFTHYDIRTVKDEKWSTQIQFGERRDTIPIYDLSSYIKKDDELSQLNAKVSAGSPFIMSTSGGYEWTYPASIPSYDYPLIEYVRTYTGDEYESQKPISRAEYEGYVDKYLGANHSTNEFQHCKNVVYGDGFDLKTWNVSSEDELLTDDEMAIALHQFSRGTVYDGLPEVTSTIAPEIINELEAYMSNIVQTMHYNSDNPELGGITSFDVATIDNEDLYDLACLYYNINDVFGHSDYYNDDASYDLNVVYGIKCERVNSAMERIFGRTVDFTPFRVDAMPTPRPADDRYTNYVYGDMLYQEPAHTTHDNYDPDILHIYDVGDGLYLADVSVKENSFETYFYGNSIAVLKQVDDHLQILKIYPINELPALEEVRRYIVNTNPKSNFIINYDGIAAFTELSQYVDALNTALEKAGTLNDAGNNAVTVYLEYAAKNYSPTVIGEKNNVVTISSKDIKTAQETAAGTMSALRSALGETVLDREPTVMARIDAKGLNLEKPMQIRIGPEAAAALTTADALTITLEGPQHSITIPAEDLQNSGGLYVQIEPLGEDQYRLSFLDDVGNVIEHSETMLGVTLPASSENSTVQAVYGGNSDNWGGQYDPQNQTIFFQTSYTGDYTVLSDAVQIGDIDMLPQEQQNAIQFMVSRGYLPLDENGNFSPGTPLNRYTFAEALVRIFFTLDRSAETTFTDVPSDSPYYPYVASGEQEKIINGYDDHTYRGENEVKRWHVILLCSRTLENKKGYIPPEDPLAYLNFVDNSEIESLCNDEDLRSVALAVREGLIDNGGVLVPNRAISKGEAAWILYKLFMLLYEVSPAPMIISEETPPISSSGTLMLAGGIVVGCGGLGAAAYFLIRKKKPMAKK